MVRVQLPQYFLFKPIVTNVVLETIAELSVLAMAMFLAAFFCFKIILFPNGKTNSIEKIYDIEETIRQKQ
ncbi:MAG: hypothetical protein CMF96_05430 [Candidatus Marinimicrobia bacterium]|nr:hypothetical protein [Candidatus Neomarinimicrobiota bacterium]